MEKPKPAKRKGIIGLFLIFVIFSFVLVFLFAFAIPLLIHMDVTFYEAGQDILNMTDLDDIPEGPIKEQLTEALDSSKASIPDQIDILSFFHQYSWLIIIIIVLFIVFMQSRYTVETDYIR